MSLFKKLFEAQKNVGKLRKTGKNGNQGYSYAEISEVVKVCREALIAEGLFTVGRVVDGSQRQVLREKIKGNDKTSDIYVSLLYELVIIDPETGEQFNVTAQGEGVDVGDKAIYKAMSGARKYAYFSALNIAAGDDAEADGLNKGKRPYTRRESSPPPQQYPPDGYGYGYGDTVTPPPARVASPPPPSRPVPQTPPPAPSPAPVALPTAAPAPTPQADPGAIEKRKIIAEINKIMGDKELSSTVAANITGLESLKTATNEQLNAALERLRAYTPAATLPKPKAPQTDRELYLFELENLINNGLTVEAIFGVTGYTVDQIVSLPDASFGTAIAKLKEFIISQQGAA